jgi:hypothetical protein
MFMLCNRFRTAAPALALAMIMAPAFAQRSDAQDKNLDVRSSAGDLHIGSDADARKIGLALYPGAKLKTDDKDGDHNDQANLSLFTEAFGMKLVVANYESDSAPAKVIDFYRDQLKKYGKVLECHSQKRDVTTGTDHDVDDSQKSKALKCEGDNSGPVTELKVGTEENQHVVAVEPRANNGSTFALVYVHIRGKQGDI